MCMSERIVGCVVVELCEWYLWMRVGVLLMCVSVCVCKNDILYKEFCFLMIKEKNEIQNHYYIY